MSRVRNNAATAIWEVALIVAICAGWFIYASVAAVVAGFPAVKFADGSLLDLIWYELFVSLIASVVLVARGWQVADFAFPISLRDTLVGCVLTVISYGAYLLLLNFGKHMIPNDQFVEEAKNISSLSIATILVVSLGNGIFEEFLLTRYLLEALTSYGVSIAIGLSALIRLSYHLYQGPLGAISVLAFGLIVTLFYWRFRRIWPVMFAHVLTDIVALAGLMR